MRQVYPSGVAPTILPIADAGANQTQSSLAVVTLDGSGSSDPLGRTLTYAWVLQEIAADGTISTQTGLLSDATAESPTFTPRELGASYMATLTVTSAGNSTTDSTLVSIEVSYAIEPRMAGVDFTALNAADFTTGGAREVAASGDATAIEITPWNPSDAHVLGPDGSTGFVVDPNGTKQQTPTTDNAPGFAWVPSSVTGGATSPVVGMAVQIEASPSRPANTSLCLSCIVTAGSNPTIGQSRFDQADLYNVRQFFKGASDDLFTSGALASMPRRMALLRYRDAVIAYYSLSTGAMTASDFTAMASGTAPSGWVRITGTHGPWMALQSTARSDTEDYEPSRDNSDPLVAVVSTNNTGDAVYEAAWFYWEAVAAS